MRKKAVILGLFIIVTFISLSFSSASLGEATYQQVGRQITTNDDIYQSIEAPETFNVSFLSDVVYGSSIKNDARLKWKITKYEKTDNFHIAEGDKNLKKGDRINLLIGADPYLQLPNVDAWCQIYVNDVMARYPSVSDHILAFYKYVLPLELDHYENGVNYTLLGDEGYFTYLETSEDVNQSLWLVEDDTVTYSYTTISETSNITEITLIYDKSEGLMNEMYYNAYYTNSTGYYAGVNMTIVRLHGWGLRYNISTLVIWIPIILVVIALIVAIRMHLFQRFKLYLEARKLVKRD